MPSVFINDGFSLKGKIEAVPGLFPSCEFSYRAGAPEVRLSVEMAATLQARIEAESKIIADHYLGFHAVNDDGSLEPIVLKQDTIKRLHPAIFRTLVNHILGYVGPSVESEAKKSHGESGS